MSIAVLGHVLTRVAMETSIPAAPPSSGSPPGAQFKGRVMSGAGTAWESAFLTDPRDAAWVHGPRCETKGRERPPVKGAFILLLKRGSWDVVGVFSLLDGMRFVS